MTTSDITGGTEREVFYSKESDGLEIWSQ